MIGSDIPRVIGLKTVIDPYTGAEVYVVPRLQPDWAVLHVHEADELGNARVYGSPFWDRPQSRAAKRVIITAERIVLTEELARQPELTLVPHFLVEAVVHAPRGAWPGSCHPYYDVDRPEVERYLALAREPGRLEAYLAEPEPFDGPLQTADGGRRKKEDGSDASEPAQVEATRNGDVEPAVTSVACPPSAVHRSAGAGR